MPMIDTGSVIEQSFLQGNGAVSLNGQDRQGCRRTEGGRPKQEGCGGEKSTDPLSQRGAIFP
eukprot:scaffold4223_cov189-Amphora_coffeaeformis.AAC.49